MSDNKTSNNVSLCVSAPADNEVLAFIASNPDLCLQCLNDDGSIDLDGVKTIMRKSRKTKILENYIDDIRKLNGKSDKRYYIRLKDETRNDGRYTIKANTRDELLDKIYAWHIEQQRLHEITESTLASLHDEFFEHKKITTWSAATVKKNQSIWDNYYADSEIIHRRIRDITLKDLKEWAYGLIREKSLTKKEFNNVCTWMKQMFEYALQEDIIEKNPYQFLKITNQNVFRHTEVKSSENLVLSDDNELALYCKCWEYFVNRHYPVHQLIPLAIITLFQLGLRPSEVCVLKYSDIEGDEIVIRRYFSEKGKCILEDRTKAGHGFKRIPLTDLEKELIALAHARQIEENVDSEYIFMMTDNFYSFYQGLRKSFPAICEAAAIPRNTPYSGRRTFISSLIDSNVNIKTIQDYVGHKSSKTTFNNYCFDRSGKQQRVEQLNNARLSLSVNDISNHMPVNADLYPDFCPSVPRISP